MREIELRNKQHAGRDNYSSERYIDNLTHPISLCPPAAYCYCISASSSNDEEHLPSTGEQNLTISAWWASHSIVAQMVRHLHHQHEPATPPSPVLVGGTPTLERGSLLLLRAPQGGPTSL